MVISADNIAGYYYCQAKSFIRRKEECIGHWGTGSTGPHRWCSCWNMLKGIQAGEGWDAHAGRTISVDGAGNGGAGPAVRGESSLLGWLAGVLWASTAAAAAKMGASDAIAFADDTDIHLTETMWQQQQQHFDGPAAYCEQHLPAHSLHCLPVSFLWLPINDGLPPTPTVVLPLPLPLPPLLFLLLKPQLERVFARFSFRHYISSSSLGLLAQAVNVGGSEMLQQRRDEQELEC